MNSDTPVSLTTHREKPTSASSGWMFLLLVVASMVGGFALIAFGAANRVPSTTDRGPRRARPW